MKRLNLALLFLLFLIWLSSAQLVGFFSSLFSAFYSDTDKVHKSLFSQNEIAFQKEEENLINRALSRAFVAYLMKDDDSPPQFPAIEDSFFAKDTWGTACVLYRPGKDRIMVVRKGGSKRERLRLIAERVKLHSRFNDVFDEGRAGYFIQFDEIDVAPFVIDFEILRQETLDSSRFEMGVHGLRVSAGNKVRYLLPGDAFVKSIHSMNQLRRYVGRLHREIPFSELHIERYEGRSILYDGKRVRDLYRGYPVVSEISDSSLALVAHQGAKYLTRFQGDEGKFVYYYDGAKDSFRDHQHPRRNPETNPYYNMLRHNGGGLLLLYEYMRTKDDELLDSAKKAADFLLKQITCYETPSKEKACHVFYNRKSKLGGAGTALYFLSEYARLSGDMRYEEAMKGLNEHLLQSIQENGEFYYYHTYLDEPVDIERNVALFNFYYPGEALIGLISYYKHFVSDKQLKLRMEAKMKAAYNFLLEERPKRYPQYFQTLPSDSWLMMSINDLWSEEHLQDQRYLDFVFTDADTMVKLMYTKEDALYPDYPGSFYYYYGDHPYPDGARAEGLQAALELAVKVKDKERVDRYDKALDMVKLATFRLVNTPESLYAVRNKERSVWGIRFKLTRQWFRVDTIQHVAAFYSKHLYFDSKHHY